MKASQAVSYTINIILSLKIKHSPVGECADSIYSFPVCPKYRGRLDARAGCIYELSTL